MGRLIKKLGDSIMQWQTQEGKITKNIKVKIDFTLPELRATEKCDMEFSCG